jgi:hypothetical protein
MARYTPRTLHLVALLMVCGLFAGLLPSAAPARAAPPRLQLHVGGTATPINVLDRQNFVVDAFGFQPGEQVQIQVSFTAYNGNTITATKTATANVNGNVTNVTITAAAGAKQGWADVKATGQTSKREATGRVYVLYRPSISLNDNTVQLGKSVQVTGKGFVANASVRISIDINTDSGTQTLSQTATTNYWGNFSKWVRIPNYTKPGTYNVTVTDTQSGIRRLSRLLVTQQPAPKPTSTPQPKATNTPTRTPTPTATPKPSFHGSASVFPGSTLPNQNITVVGTGFPGNSRVTVTLNVNLSDGTSRTLNKYPTTDGSGNLTAVMRVPYKTSPGAYAVTVSGGGTQATTQLKVLPLSAHPQGLGFQWVSLWYHTVRQGTFDVLVIQAKPQTQLGIWTHIIFPNGQHYDYYKNTDSNGKWQIKFTIPRGSVSKNSNQAHITFQLWHGKQTMQAFVTFTLV